MADLEDTDPDGMVCYPVVLDDGSTARITLPAGVEPTDVDLAAVAGFAAMLRAKCQEPHPFRTVEAGPHKGQPLLCQRLENPHDGPHRRPLASSMHAEPGVYRLEEWEDGEVLRTRTSTDYGQTWTNA